MAVPTYDLFIAPMLRVLAAHPKGLRSRDAYAEIASSVGLTEEDRTVLLPSGGQPLYQNRIGWAHDRLKRAGYSQSLQRGYWQLTQAGRDFVAKHPHGLDAAAVDAIASVPRTSKLTDGAATTTTTGVEPAVTKPAPPLTPIAPQVQSPEERIDDAIEELNESLARDLLAMISEASPAFFERLVLDLLLAMRYGATRADLRQVGGSGDGGVDGIIALDRLGLEKVYVQAKRWKGSVGRPEIQGFFGALAGRRARKGVFITTSTFTREAKEYARSVSDSMVLVDGETLATLMIEHGVGVSSHKTLRIARLDGDYFEDA